MHRRLVPLSSRRAAEHRRGGSCEVVWVSRVEGRTPPPARGAPPSSTPLTRYAREGAKTNICPGIHVVNRASVRAVRAWHTND